MTEIINFNKARKKAAKADKEKQADANRRKHGRTKAEKQADAKNKEQSTRHIEAHKRDKDEVDNTVID